MLLRITRNGENGVEFGHPPRWGNRRVADRTGAVVAWAFCSGELTGKSPVDRGKNARKHGTRRHRAQPG